MILIECQQGSEEWLAARAGATTASRFTDAVSTVGGLTDQQRLYVTAIRNGASDKEACLAAGYKAKPTSSSIAKALKGEKVEEASDAALRYAADIAMERISRRPYGIPVKAWTLERGHVMEEAGRIAYESRQHEFVTESGIVLTDDRLFGYSTDGLVGDDGLIEIKCPIDSTKIANILRTGDVSEYMHQMQGGMWITGRKWVDFIMYVPDLETSGKDLYVKRVERDDDFIDAMVDGLMNFERHVQYFEELFGPAKAA